MKNPTKYRVTLFLKIFPVILALGFLARALPPGASAQGYVSAVPPAPASGQNSADNAVGVPAGITDALTQLIQQFAGRHPRVALALSAMVLLRVALKPAMSLIEALVAGDPAEAEALANFEAGPWFHVLAWFLDYAASIKLKACLVKFGRNRQAINCRYLALAGLLISLTGCVTSNVLAGHYVESITTRGLGVDVSATTSSTGTPRVYFGAFSETVTFMPTETNGTIATPNYANNLESQSTWNPLGQGINESIVSGSDQAWAGTNVSAQPIVPKISNSEFRIPNSKWGPIPGPSANTPALPKN